MADVQRVIGAIEARVDEHDSRFDRIEEKIDVGFARVHERLDELADAESRRRGALGLVKLLLSGSAITGAIAAAKALFGGHK